MKKLIVCALLFAANNLSAQVAIVLSTTDVVKASHKGASRVLSRGSSLNVGDSVVTGSSAQASIKYKNGTVVTISSNSNYTILDYSAKGKEQLKTELKSGSIAFKTNGKSKESIKTPVVALAVLGTSAAVEVKGPNTGTGTCCGKNNSQTNSGSATNVVVEEGAIQARDVTITAGQSYQITVSGITPGTFPSLQQLIQVNTSVSAKNSGVTVGGTVPPQGGGEETSNPTTTSTSPSQQTVSYQNSAETATNISNAAIGGSTQTAIISQPIVSPVP